MQEHAQQVRRALDRLRTASSRRPGRDLRRMSRASSEEGIAHPIECVALRLDVVRAREAELQGTLLEYLNGRRDVTVLGETSADPAVRVPTVSFVVEGWNSQELVEKVEKDSNFAFRWGSFYSNRLAHELLGLGSDGVVRISMVHYNTGEFAYPPTKLCVALLTYWISRGSQGNYQSH